MLAPSTSSPRARLARGGVSWVTVLLLSLLVGGGYLAYVWGPVYIVHFQVKQVVRDYMNQAVKNRNDAALVEKMVHKMRTLGTLEMPGDDGEPVEIPAVDVDPRTVVWERDAESDPPLLHVQLEYTRPVYYPLLDRWTEITLGVDFTQDVAVPNWGPDR